MKTDKVLELQHSKKATQDLDRIATYYEAQSPGLGYNFASYYNQQISMLKTFKALCRPGIRAGTREMVLQKFPYIVVYKVKAMHIQIVTIYHQKLKQP